MNISERFIALFILVAVGFFGFNMAHSGMSNNQTVNSTLSSNR